MGLTTVDHSSATLRILTYRRLFVILLKRAGDEADLQVILERQQKLWGSEDGKVLSLTVVSPIAELKFPPAYIAALKTLYKSIHPHMEASAIVLAGKGIQRSFARSVLTVITAATPGKPVQTFEKLQEAVKWITEQGPELAKHSAGLSAELLYDFNSQGDFDL